MSDQLQEAPPSIGHNQPPLPALISAAAETEDFSKLVTEWLNERYGSSKKIAAALLAECADLMKDPETGELRDIADTEMKGKVASLAKRIRDEVKKLEGIHGKEKTAYLRGSQAVDQYVFGIIDLLARRDRKNKPGAADVLLAKLTAYDVAVLAAEQARRQAEADRLAREAAERAEEERLAREAAEEAQAAADRARNPEIIETKQAVAEDKAAEVAPAAAAAQVAADAATEAKLQTYSKPADVMRQRVDDGTLATMKTEPYAEVIPGQDGLLNKDMLWPFIKLEAKEMAVRAWAKNTGYTQQMAGASIGKRPKSVVR